MAADDINIKINTAINDAGSAKSIADLRKSMKELQNLTLQVGEGGKGFKQLQSAINETEGKLGDLGDSLATVKGSGVERLHASFGLLKESFTSFDPGKASIGFKAIGAAMKAIPIFLIVEGIKFLIEKFDELKSAGGVIGKVFSAIGDGIGFVIDKIKEFSDWIGLTNFKEEERAKNAIKNANEQKDKWSEIYDQRIRLEKALHKDTLDLEIKKQEAIKATTKVVIDEYQKRIAAGGELTDNEKKELEAAKKAHNEANIAIVEIYSKANDERLKKQKDADEKSKKLREERLADEKKLLRQIEDEHIALIDNQEERELAAAKLANQRAVEDINNSKASKEVKNKALAALELDLQNQLADIQNKYIDEQEKKDAEALAKKQLAADQALKAAQDAANQALQIRIQSATLEKQIIDQQLQDQRLPFDAKVELLNKELQLTLDVIAAQRDAQLATIADQIAILEQKHANGQLYSDAELQQLQNLQNQKKNVLDKANNDEVAATTATENKKKQLRQQTLDQYVGATRQALGAAQGIADLVFAHNLRQAKGNAEKEKEIRKKQFKVNKAFQLAGATIDGIQSVMKALNNPYPLNLILAVVSGAAAAVNIAKIVATKFDDGGSDTAAGGAADTGSTGGAIGGGEPAQAAAAPEPGKLFNPDVINRQTGIQGDADAGAPGSTAPIKVFVTETDISQAQNKVSVIEQKSTIG